MLWFCLTVVMIRVWLVRLGPFVVAFDVIPTAQGVISVSVPGNNVTDLGFNPNIASTCGATTGPCTFLFDSVRPTATITTSTLSITNTLLPYNVTFSEFVQYFNTSNINVFGTARCSLLDERGGCLRRCFPRWSPHERSKVIWELVLVRCCPQCHRRRHFC